MKISPTARRLLLPLGLFTGFVGFTWIQAIFAPENYYRRDFLADYLPAKACLNGLNPYTPLPELAQRFDYPLPPDLFRHPTPHSPGLLLLSLPVGLFDYRTANLIWLSFSLLCLLLALHLLLQSSGAPVNWGLTLLLGWAALAWGPLAVDLVSGQIDTWLLLLGVSAWLALRSGRNLFGGMLLGLSLTLKLIVWPFGLYLLLRREWRALFGMGLTFGLAHGVALAVMGGVAIKDYYLQVGPAVGQIYRGYFSNLALTSLGWRLFQGTEDALSLSPPVLVQPLFESVWLARLSALLLPLLLLAVTLWLVWRARSFTTAFCLLLCASLLLGPLCWFHYFTVLLFPLVVLVRRLAQVKTPLLRGLACLVFWLTALPHHFYVNSALKFGVQLAGSNVTALPFAASLLPSLGTFLVMGWMYLLWRTDGHAEAVPKQA